MTPLSSATAHVECDPLLGDRSGVRLLGLKSSEDGWQIRDGIVFSKTSLTHNVKTVRPRGLRIPWDDDCSNFMIGQFKEQNAVPLPGIGTIGGFLPLCLPERGEHGSQVGLAIIYRNGHVENIPFQKQHSLVTGHAQGLLR